MPEWLTLDLALTLLKLGGGGAAWVASQLALLHLWNRRLPSVQARAFKEAEAIYTDAIREQKRSTDDLRAQVAEEHALRHAEREACDAKLEAASARIGRLEHALRAAGLELP